MPFQEYKEIVGMLASVATIGQCFSPVVMCYDIYKKKSTEDVDSTPFVGGMGLSLLMLQHALLLNDPAMIPVNIFCFVLNVIYFYIYLCYTKEKNSELMKCAKTGAFVAVLISYAQYDEPTRAEFYFGIILTILMFLLISAPLFSLGEIIRTESTASLPFPLILSGTLVSFLWLLYGIIIENIFVLVQNIVGFGLCAFQLSLFVIYPSKPVEHDKKIN